MDGYPVRCTLAGPKCEPGRNAAGNPDAAVTGYALRTPTRNDSSVTGWCVMALKSATAAKLDTRDGLAGCRWWLEEAWRATNPNHEALDVYGRSQFPYTFNEVTRKSSKDHLSCVGALCAVFLGYDAGDKLLATMVNDIIDRHLDKSRTWPTDSYYLYYNTNTLAVFQHGGDPWRRWNDVVRDMLVDSQRRDGCFEGSQGPQGAGAHHIAAVGRTLVTAYACLSLEVYYRYLPVALDG